MPNVYIILVNYNGYNDTIECAESLQKLNYNNLKVIIIDNASNDDSIKYLKQLPKDYIIIELKENLGFAGGNNVGIKYAMKHGADYIVLLNNDTVVEEDFLIKLVEVAEKDKLIGIVGGKIYYYSDPCKIWYAGGKINSFTGKTKHIGIDTIDNSQYDKICETEYVTGCMMLVTRQAIERAGLMDESYFLYYEETDWNMKIKKNGFKIVYTPHSKIYHKVSSSTKRINNAVAYYYDRNCYYFIMRNFGVINKIFMYFYMRVKLCFKFLKAIIHKKKEKNVVVKHTYFSIKNNITGELKL